MSGPIRVSVNVIGDSPIKVDVKAPIIQGEDTPEYEGPYSVTPTQAEQILPTKGKTADQNIVVNPIPNNYGLITWNGSVLTVS